MKTLSEFIKEKGSQEHAAYVIGISFTTLSRLINGHHKPSTLLNKRLHSIGVEIVEGDIKKGGI